MEKKQIMNMIICISIIVGIVIAYLMIVDIEKSDEGNKTKNINGIVDEEFLKIAISNPAEKNFMIIVPIADSGKYNEPEINNNLSIIEGDAEFIKNNSEKGLGLKIESSSELVILTANANENVCVFPTMLNKSKYWFFLNCDENLTVSYELYSISNFSSSLFINETISLHQGWNLVGLYGEMTSV